ncbi:MAG: hypothetical protein U0235_23650 [Polyangiaceae bacterium]
MLFKRFTDIDVFDVKVAETGITEVRRHGARLEPNFGGINLENIRRPRFFIEEELRRRTNRSSRRSARDRDRRGRGA